MTIAPVIETYRLRLRPHRAEDFEAWAAFLASDRSVHMGGPYSRKDAWYFFAAEVGEWPLYGYGAWAVEMADTGKFVGQVSVSKPDDYPELELGWAVLDTFEGQGIAYEAAIAARGFAFDTLGRASIVSYIDPENTRSIRLAERLGAEQDLDAPGQDATDLVYRHWAAARGQA
ncbi:MAG: GNAT family N-acetyltransferase [Pseudomonadota bacterium]